MFIVLHAIVVIVCVIVIIVVFFPLSQQFWEHVSVFFHILGTCLTLYSSFSFMLLAGFSCSWCILSAMQAMWGDSRPPILSSSFTLRHLTTSMFSKSTLSKAPLDAKQNSMESNSGRWTLQCCKKSLVVWMVALLAWKTRSKLLCSSGFMQRNFCSGTSPTLSLPMPA